MSAQDETPRWREMDAQTRADAYSPSKALPDGDLTPFLDAYARDSEAVYRRYSDVQVLPYGAKASQTIDLFSPKTDAAAPLHIFIHGGYWQALSKRESTFAAPGFLENGVAFAAIDYTLAPQATLPEIVAECLSAVTYLFENARMLGIDPARITLSGSSAGAHLAAMTCLGLSAANKLQGVVLLSGVYELEPLIGTYVNDPLKLDKVTAQANSPMLQDLSSFPPTLIAWGAVETDEFKRQSKCFAEHLGTVECSEIAEHNHFDVVYALSDESDFAKRVLTLASA